jgi:hypothetical protein
VLGSCFGSLKSARRVPDRENSQNTHSRRQTADLPSFCASRLIINISTCSCCCSSSRLISLSILLFYSTFDDSSTYFFCVRQTTVLQQRCRYGASEPPAMVSLFFFLHQGMRAGDDCPRFGAYRRWSSGTEAHANVCWMT